MTMNVAIGGPGANSPLAWTVAGVAPNLLLTNGAFVYSALQSCASVEQIGIHLQVISPGLTTATMRMRWSPDGTAVYDEVVEGLGALVAGPPAAQQYTLNLKEWGPIVSGATPGRQYTILRPAVAHFLAIGINWGAAPAAGDSVNVWLERQSS